MTIKGKSKKGVEKICDYISYYTKSGDAKNIIGSSNIFNEEGFDVWSFKKLIFLDYYIKPFLDITLNQDCKCFFIDLFSSCGANKSEDIISIGSPIISILKGIFPNSAKNRNNKFCKWFFVESDENYSKALKTRVEKTFEIVNERYSENLRIDKDAKILCGDCNNVIDLIIKEIYKVAGKDKFCVLIFVDPYSFTNIEWTTWEKIASLRYVDVIFTFPIGTLKRGLSCKDIERYLPPSLKGKDILNIPETFEKAYARGILNITQRGQIWHYQKGIPATIDRNVELYRIELFTYSKKGLEISLSISNMLESLKAEDLRKIIDQVLGKTTSLNDFF